MSAPGRVMAVMASHDSAAPTNRCLVCEWITLTLATSYPPTYTLRTVGCPGLVKSICKHKVAIIMDVYLWHNCGNRIDIDGLLSTKPVYEEALDEHEYVTLCIRSLGQGYYEVSRGKHTERT